MEFEKPYYAITEDLPGHDFNKEFVSAGLLDNFPDGVIGIRVDDDFWQVAALPFEEYKDKSIKEIVSEIWPHIVDPEFGPDVTTTKEEIEMVKRIESLKPQS